MASAMNRVVVPSIFSSARSWSSASLWWEVAEKLRQVTVRVIGAAGHHGAGVVWSSDGLIITNAHVVNGSCAIRLHNGSSFRAEVLRKDRSCDLALLRISATGIESAWVRDSRTLRAGEMVVAVGHPMGVTEAVSAGIVQSAGDGWIETDTRLAPGNSGGPLGDVEGRVVGINSMVVNGVGIAISSTAVDAFLRRF